jgi:hypothetical protein
VVDQPGVGVDHVPSRPGAVIARSGRKLANQSRNPPSPRNPATLAGTGTTIPSAAARAATVRRLRLDGRSSDLHTEPQLAKWVELGTTYARSLPAKR